MTGQDDIIQQARDTLAKWRDGTTDLDGMPIAYLVPEGDLALIMGTAGNPDLLDAIYSMLAASQAYFGDGGWPGSHANNIAAAIVAAEERMQS